MSKEYGFEMQEINGKREVVLCLRDFLDVKFRYASVRFGNVDEDQKVPLIFEIDLVGENQNFPEDSEFGNQAALILVELLDKILPRNHEVINSIN